MGGENIPVIKSLGPEQLYHACDMGSLEFDTTAELDHLSQTVGQERAFDSIQFGIGIPHEGYNLYVMGSTGLGRHTMVGQALSKQAKEAKSPPDWCYISNFERPHKPIALSVPAGIGCRLRSDLERLIDNLLNAIP